MPNDRNDRNDPPEDADAEIEAAWAEVEPRNPKQEREDFRTARMALVDLYCDASGGTLHHSAFNKARIDAFADIACEAGVRHWTELHDENASLRSAVGAEIAGRHRHLGHDDLADVLDPSTPFDLDQVLTRAAEVSTQRSESARGLLTAALADAGVDTSAPDFDPAAALQAAAQPKAAATPELPEDPLRSTPMSRTASLPKGHNPGGDWMKAQPPDHLWGDKLIEWQVNQDRLDGKY